MPDYNDVLKASDDERLAASEHALSDLQRTANDHDTAAVRTAIRAMAALYDVAGARPTRIDGLAGLRTDLRTTAYEPPLAPLPEEPSG